MVIRPRQGPHTSESAAEDFLSYPAMSSAFASRSSPSRAELELKAEKQAEYVKQLWFLLAAVIGLLSIINWTRRLLRRMRSPKAQKRGPDTPAESAYAIENVPFPSNSAGRVHLRRIPQAISSFFRVLAFRTTVPIGPSSVMLVSELTFIAGYIVALLVWLWINSESQNRSLLSPLTRMLPLADDLDTFFFEDRAAHLASCQIPLIVALAGKNNIIACKPSFQNARGSALICSSSHGRKP